MSSRLPQDQRSRWAVRLNEAGGYVAAVVLPWIGMSIALHVRALQSTPFALTFASVAGITLLWSVRQGLVATFFTTLFFNYYVCPPVRQWSLNGRNIFYGAIIFCIGLLITWICHRQNATSARLRAALTSYREQTDALMEAQQGSNSVAWTLSAVDLRMRWSEGGSEVFGRPFSEIAALNSPELLIMEEDWPSYEAALKGVGSSAKVFHAEYRVKWPSGEIHWLESRGTPSPAEAGIWRGVTIDVTDRKNVELALIHSEKLAAVGRLSATIAHEINNPLEVITNLLYLALRDEALGQQTREYLASADQQVARLASISRHTLTFARHNSSKGPTRVEAVAEIVVAMFEPRCHAPGSEIRLLRTADVWVAAPTDELRQILTNLVSNACDALIGAEGTVEVEIAAEDELAVIEVRDNGAGIAGENRERIFDAFFSTKGGLGTGIGLWVTKDLVEKNGGHISLVGGKERGFRTVFRIEFPLVETPVEALADNSAAKA